MRTNRRGDFRASSYNVWMPEMKCFLTQSHTRGKKSEKDTWKPNERAVSLFWQEAEQWQRDNKRPVVLHCSMPSISNCVHVCSISIFVMCGPDRLFSVFNLTKKTWEFRHVDICTCVGHSDFMTPFLLPSPVVSGWFIQRHMQSQTIRVACNDSVMLLEEVKEDSQRQEEDEWGGVGRHKTVFGTVGMLKPFPLTYTGLISALLAASVVLLGHLQLRHIRNVRKQRVKLSANVERWER